MIANYCETSIIYQLVQERGSYHEEYWVTLYCSTKIVNVFRYCRTIIPTIKNAAILEMPMDTNIEKLLSINCYTLSANKWIRFTMETWKYKPSMPKMTYEEWKKGNKIKRSEYVDNCFLIPDTNWIPIKYK